MKRTLLAAFALLICALSHAQKIKITDPSNEWLIKHRKIDSHDSNYDLHYSYWGDTSIGGITYRNLFGNFVREDTLTKKVYVRTPNFISADTGEVVLYDYNWALGDTVKYPPASGGYMHFIYWVDNIDSTMINGLWYKVWALKGIRNEYYTPLEYVHFYVIEGIGCTNSYFGLVSNHEQIWANRLFCFKNGGTTYAFSLPVPSYYPPDGSLPSYLYFDNSTSCTLGITSDMPKEKLTAAFPNPINESSKIPLPYFISSGKLVIYNSIGQIIVTRLFVNKDELQIWESSYRTGGYHYAITDNNTRHTITGKFIFRN